MLLDPDLLKLYLVAAVVLVLAPGPDSLLVLTRSVADGRRAGFVSTAGIMLGNLVHATAASAGISALIAGAPALFDLLRLAGSCYLAWLGAKAILGARAAWRSAGRGELPAAPARRPGRTFVHALLTNLLNPKIILFYLAFVPQFVAPALGHVALQTFLLGALLAVMGAAYMIGLTVLGAGAAQRAFRSGKVRAALDGAAGLIFLGFALRLFLTERKFA